LAAPATSGSLRQRSSAVARSSAVMYAVMPFAAAGVGAVAVRDVEDPVLELGPLRALVDELEVLREVVGGEAVGGEVEEGEQLAAIVEDGDGGGRRR
jgi:hypothetical protein